MKTYIQKIYKTFHELGFDRESLLSKKQTATLIQDTALAHSSLQKVEPQVIDQLWNHCPKVINSNDTKISVEELSVTISEAIKTLKYDYDEITKKLNEDCTQNQKKKFLLDLYSVSNNYQMLAFPFNISKLQQSPYIYQSLKLIPETIRNKEKYIFSFQFTEQTTGLKIVLWVTMLMLGLQVLMMFHKTHFYTLLCFCMVISIFLLNYFDAAFIRFLIGNLLFSTLFDVIWEISFAKKYWNQEGDDFVCFQHSSILKFSTIFVILIAVGKLMIAGILFKYRNNPSDLCINITPIQFRCGPKEQSDYQTFLIYVNYLYYPSIHYGIPISDSIASRHNILDKVYKMSFGNNPFKVGNPFDLNASTEDIINVIRSLNQPTGGSCPKKPSEQGQKSENSIGQKPSLSQQIRRVHFSSESENPVRAYQVIRKRKKSAVDSVDALDAEFQLVDSQSNKRITDYFENNSHHVEKKFKPLDSVSPQQMNQQSDDGYNSHPIVKNLKQKIAKKKKCVEDLKLQVETLSRRNNATQLHNIDKIEGQKQVLVGFLLEQYKQKIYYETIKRMEVTSQFQETEMQNRYISALNNKIKMLDQEKKKKNNKDQNEEATYLLEYYGADRQNYIKQWRKKIEAEKIAMQKQQAKKNAFHELNYKQKYFQLPDLLIDQYEKPVILDSKYLPLYSREDPSRLLSTEIEVRALDLQSLVQINLLVIPLPKMMKNDKKIEAHVLLQKIFRKNLEFNKNRCHTLFTKTIYFEELENDNYFTLGYQAWPEKGSRICLNEMLKKYQSFSEPIAKYIVKFILRGLEQLRTNFQIATIILPSNIIFNERNQIKLDSWVKNQLIKFPEYQDYFLSEQRHLYFPPEFKKKIYENDIGSISIWIIGVVFYELLFAKKPFNYQKNIADHEIDSFYIINSVDFPQKPNISEAVKDFIKQCLTAPEDRLTLSKALKHPSFDIKK